MDEHGKIAENRSCKKLSHRQHMCYMIADGIHHSRREEYKEMVRNAGYMCKHCGRVAAAAEHLCEPLEL